MLSLTSDEFAIRGRLLAIAASHTPETITYEELWVAATGRGWQESAAFYRIGTLLYHIAAYEHRLGRPMLTALVVRKETERPGDGFYDLAEEYGRDPSDRDALWEQEKDAVRDFWSQSLDPSAVVRDRYGPTLAWDPTRLGDIATLAVMDQIKRQG